MEVSQSLQVGFEILHQISVDWELAWLTVSKLSSLVALLGREVSQARRLSKALQKSYFQNVLELVVHIRQIHLLKTIVSYFKFLSNNEPCEHVAPRESLNP